MANPNMIPCPHCGKMVVDTSMKCLYCKNYIQKIEYVEDFEEIAKSVTRDQWELIKITSTNTFETNRIIEYKDFISSGVVVPNGILGFITAGTFFTCDSLNLAKAQAKIDIAKLAVAHGANAIVGFDLDISSVYGGVLVSANGTAVVIEK